MKNSTIERFLDQKRFITHIWFLLFSLLLIGISITLSNNFHSWKDHISTLVLLFLQIEIFIFLGINIFSSYNPASTPGVITREIFVRFIIFFMACMLIALILVIASLFVEYRIRDIDTAGMLHNFFQNRFGHWFKTTFRGLSLGAIIFVYTLWQSTMRREQKLKEENLIFQNETLQNQVNPHFLFNSLNTLSSLIASDPEAADRFVGKLASIYRYILENGRRDKIPLSSELEYVSNYIDLHKIRDEDKIFLSVNITDPGSYMIIPVSLQILIENAIKHNKATREEPLYIEVYEEDRYIVVRNNLQRMGMQLNSMGLGIKNLTSRVELTTNRPVIIEETDDHFIVKVPLI